LGNGLGEKEKDATLQDIRRLRETLLSLSRSLGDFAEVLHAPNVNQLLSAYRREVGVWLLLLGRLQEAPPTKATEERAQQQGLILTELEKRLKNITAIDSDQLEQAESLMKDLMAASEKTREVTDQVTVMPSTEDTNLAANTLPASQIDTVANLELANQTGQNGEKIRKSGKSTGVTSPENKRDNEQVSDGRALNDDPIEDDATSNAKTRPEKV